MTDDFKGNVLQEVERALSLESEMPVGFVAVVLTERKKDGRIIPTLIDMAYGGLGKLDSEVVRQRFRELGGAIGDEISKNLNKERG